LKLVSEVMSTIMIFAIVLGISLLSFMITLSMLANTAQTAEYGYVKTIFLNFANSIPDLLEGGSYAASIPSRNVGIGYVNFTDMVFELEAAGKLLVRDYPIAIYVKPSTPVVTVNRTLYGVNSYVVDNPLHLARVEELYVRGENRIVLHTVRAYTRIYLYQSGSESRYVVYVTYVRLKPVTVSTQPSRIVVNVESSSEVVEVVDLNSLTSGDVMVIRVGGSTVYTLNRNSLTQANTVYVNVKVITLRVVFL